ncbi:MAG: SAF domain-containing protein [Myxococcales bacterium]
MGLLAKSVLYGTIAGAAWVSGRAVPVFLEWRQALAGRVEVVAFARDVVPGQRLAAQDLRTVRVASEVADEGSALRQAGACVGRTVRCSATAGAVVVQGCLGRAP